MKHKTCRVLLGRKKEMQIMLDLTKWYRVSIWGQIYSSCVHPLCHSKVAVWLAYRWLGSQWCLSSVHACAGCLLRQGWATVMALPYVRIILLCVLFGKVNTVGESGILSSEIKCWLVSLENKGLKLFAFFHSPCTGCRWKQLCNLQTFPP